MHHKDKIQTIQVKSKIKYKMLVGDEAIYWNYLFAIERSTPVDI